MIFTLPNVVEEQIDK